MRRRLTIAILGVVLGTLVLTVAASVLLVQGAAISTSEGQLTPEAQALARIVSSYAAVTIERVDKDLQQAGGLDVLTVVSVTPEGNFSSVPPSLQASVMNPHTLLAGETVTGNVGHEVFVAVPLTVARARKLALGIPASDQAVLVVARHVKSPVNGVGYFVLVAGVVLVIGAAVAALVSAEDKCATRRRREHHWSNRPWGPVCQGPGEPSRLSGARCVSRVHKHDGRQPRQVAGPR